jgi:hypothetical protein
LECCQTERGKSERDKAHISVDPDFAQTDFAETELAKTMSCKSGIHKSKSGMQSNNCTAKKKSRGNNQKRARESHLVKRQTKTHSLYCVLSLSLSLSFSFSFSLSLSLSL